MADVADEVDKTLVHLSLVIQNLEGAGDFPNIHLNEGVRIAAIYLSAAVMDCLTALIDWVNASSISPLVVVITAHVSWEKGLYEARFLRETEDCPRSVNAVQQCASIQGQSRKEIR